MLRAFSLQWRAKVSRYGLAVGMVPILGSLAGVFRFQQERLPGLKELDVNFPSPSRIAPGAIVPAPVPGFENVVPMLARLPNPPVERLPGVLCDPNGNVGFGASIAAYGNRIAVGAITDDTAGLEAGAVYLYERDLETGQWQYTARILADADQKLAARTFGRRRQAMFGRAVALSDGVLAVMQGSIYHGGPTGEFPDNVYVFGATGEAGTKSDGSRNGWRQEARLPTPMRGLGHGRSIAFLDSHTLLVAAPMAEPVKNGAPEGAVYVYRRQQKSESEADYRWVMLGQLRPPPDAKPDQRFAISLQAENDLVAVGMANAVGGTKSETGRIWSLPLYRRPSPHSPPDKWSFMGGIKAPDYATGHFGASLALRDNLLAVYQAGAPLDGTTETRKTRVFVYRAPEPEALAEDWVYEGELPYPADGLNPHFGLALATDGRSIVVGDGIAGTNEVRTGLAFVYRRPPGQNWILHQTLGPFDPMNSGAFGYVLALHEGVLFVNCGDALLHPDHGSVFFRRL